MKRLLVFVIVCTFWSCKLVEVEILKPQYNVYCILNPDDKKIELFLGNVYNLNEPIKVDSGKYISKAEIFIFDKEDSLQLKLNPRTKKYEAINNNFLHYGTTYNLTIKTPYLPILSSKTTIPTPIQDLSYKGESDGNMYVVRAFWTNNFQDNCYFKITGTVISSNSYFSFFLWDNNEAIWRIDYKDIYSKIIQTPTGAINIDKLDSQVSLILTLSSMDSIFADYDKKNIKSLTQDGGLLEKFSQPVVLPSNINNGIGIFGSIINKQITIKIR
jgi:hypothetical protein